MPIMRRGGRPGLLGMAARTAVVAGTATAVSGAVAQRQHNRAAERQALQEQQQQAAFAPVTTPAPAMPAAPATDVVTRLQQLGELHQQGLLSSEEFTLAKQQLLGSMNA
ncbi:SHOCT domain-containing protein [Microbacterium sp. A82]|uniref:SHOCT domain-containing protein n=1 Tax=unclassified Microbacterium TaxID=2609290 RepID=UPI003F2A5B59